MLGWAGVALVLLAGMGWQYRRYVRTVLNSAALPPSALEELVKTQAARFGIARPIPIKVSTAIHTPAVFGVVRPIILLPATWESRFSTSDLTNIVAHEVAHIKRGDLPITVLAAVVSCLYWFHPAVWFASLQHRREREMACDDLVLDDRRERGKDYAGALLRAAEHFEGPIPAGAGFLGLLELSDNLLGRVVSATDERRMRRMGYGSAVALVAMLLILPMGVWSATAGEGAAEAVAAVDEEIAAHYTKADPEVQEYIRWTARQFGRGGLWLPANAFDDLTPAQREEKVAYYTKVLDGEYGRHLCEALSVAGVLQDKRLLPGVLKAATYHRTDSDYDCRPKWMAVAAAGRIGDESAVPALIPLVDHGNQNTRMWARASLVRLTGQNFGDDKKAWGEWWNSTGKGPKIDPADLKPWTPPAGVAPSSGHPTKTAPEIVSVTPAIGAKEVDPGVKELRVTFDQDMSTDGYSWTDGGEVFPKTTGKPHWADARTCVLPVALERARFYRVGINSESHKKFRGINGIAARDRVLYFATEGLNPAEFAKLTPPTVVSLSPENNAKGVPASTTKLTVTFDKPMGPGFSWVTMDDRFPETTGRPEWNEDRTACTIPVKLQPNSTCRLGLNSPRHINFQSASGLPLEPIVWTFTTAE